MTNPPAYYKKGFDTFAVNAYDLFVNLATFYQMTKYRFEGIRMLHLKKGQTAIDFACGTGEFTILLAQQVGETGKVIGIDLSQRMLEIAIKKSARYPQISYLRQNFEDVSAGEYDVAVIGLAAHEVPKEARVNLYRSASNSLKKGGKLLIMDYAPYKKGVLYRVYLKTIESPYGFEYASEDHEKVLKPLGFDPIEKTTFFRVFDSSIYRKL